MNNKQLIGLFYFKLIIKIPAELKRLLIAIMVLLLFGLNNMNNKFLIINFNGT